MRCQRLPTCAPFLLVPLLLWAALAAWQWNEYLHERALTEDTLRRQAESIQRALVGGIRSHRRFGPFFAEMTQGSLNELASSEDILAVGIAARSETRPMELLLHAGQKELLETSLTTDLAAARFVADFRLDPAPDDGPHTPGTGPGGGRGRGRG